VSHFKVYQKEEVHLVNSKNLANQPGEVVLIRKVNLVLLKRKKMNKTQNGLILIPKKKPIHSLVELLKMKKSSEKLLKRRRRDSKKYGVQERLNIKSKRKSLIN
jgi:hypothetical protein